MLIVTRFKDIARFTALSGNLVQTGLFILYQVPLILPIAIPISALLASFLLFQRLSLNQELTALRTAGLPLRALLAPLLLASLLLSLFNFSFCASISPFCRREAKALFYRETSQNPLLLLRRQKLVKIKNAYLHMNPKDDLTTKDFRCIAYNESNRSLNLFSAQKLWIENDTLFGEDLSILSYLPQEKGFDSLIIENQSKMSTSAPLLSKALKKKRPRLDSHSLSFQMLQVKACEMGKKGRAAEAEMWQRISISLAAFSFTLIGSTFGIFQGRMRSKRNLLAGLILSAFIFIGYLGAKRFAIWILIPHSVGWICSLCQLHRIARGRV